MPAARYRLFDYGTIYLTQQQRQSSFLVAVVEVLNSRQPGYESGKRLPPQGVWAYVTQRWQDAVQGPELEVRFRKSKLVLWELDPVVDAFNQCFQTNSLYTAILTELAKKPNIPPLPPSVAPTAPLVSQQARNLLIRPGAISVRSTYASDLDVTLYWGAPVDDGSSGCAPSPQPDPPTPPIEPALPTPSGAWAGPQFPIPPLLPSGAPPIGGGSLNTGGGFAGDQSVPVSAVTQTFLRLQRSVSAVGPPCINPPPEVQEYGPFPGILGAGALVIIPKPGYGATGFPCGATSYIYDVQTPNGVFAVNEFYNGYAPPVSLTPRYA